MTQVEGQYEFICPAEEAGRLDKFLVAHFPDLTRSRLQGLIRDGLVHVDGVPAGKSGQTIEAGAVVGVIIPGTQPAGIAAEAIPLDIVFENDDLMVVNKPAGMVVHPSAGHVDGTLVNAALAHAPEMEGISGEQRPGVVHRLDKDTSGLILLAKNDAAHHWLVNQFQSRKVVKVYQALVEGRPATPKGRIEAPLGRDPGNRQRMAVVPADKGREAISEYYTRETFPHHTLLDVHLLTGRTHQIRVHMAFIKCPIVADPLYGYRKASVPLGRQFLHAYRLTVTLPGESEPRTFEVPLPDDLETVLKRLREQAR